MCAFWNAAFGFPQGIRTYALGGRHIYLWYTVRCHTFKPYTSKDYFYFLQNVFIGTNSVTCILYVFLPPVLIYFNLLCPFFIFLQHVSDMCVSSRVLDAFRTLYLLSVTWRLRGICLLSLWTAGWPPKSGFFVVFRIRHTTTMPTMHAMRKTPAQYMAIST